MFDSSASRNSVGEIRGFVTERCPVFAEDLGSFITQQSVAQ